MIVECTACNTIFPVDPKKVPAGGVHARCSVCSEVFFVSVPEPDVAPMAVETRADAAPAEAEAILQEAPAEEAAEELGAGWLETMAAPEETEFAFEDGTPTFGETEVMLEEEPEPAPEELPEEAYEAETAPIEAAAEPIEEVEAAPSVATPVFGRRDPLEKAQRLARVLVSDIILYNPDRHHMATESGRVREEFEDEIQKSWDEYVEQVGEEIANTTNFFNDALNEILAKGEQLF